MFELFFLVSLLAISFSQLLPEKERPSRPNSKQSQRTSGSQHQSRARQDQSEITEARRGFHPHGNALYKASDMLPFDHKRRRHSL